MIYGKYVAAFCIPRIHEITNHDLIAALSMALAERNISLMIYTTPTDLYWDSPETEVEKMVFELINYDITDVVIIHDEVIKDKEAVKHIISKATEHNTPIITIGGHYEGCTSIHFDYSTGFERIVRHVLKDHDVKDFHFISGIKGNDFTIEREEVVRKVAAELNVPFGEENISYGEFWSRPAERAVERFFTEGKKLPQAFICANDTMAIAVINALKRHDVRVPDEVIVSGFDGIKDIKYCDPRVTTCLCSSEQLAAKIAETALRYVLGDEVEAEGYVIPVLQKSESCGCGGDSKINPSEELTYINNAFFRFQIEEEKMFRMMSRMHHCSSLAEISDILDEYRFYNLIIALKPECIDKTLNPLNTTLEKGYGDVMKVVYNTDVHMKGRVDDMPTQNLHPNLELILTQYNSPLIFFPLNYMGNCMGYTCFNFHNFDIQNYYKAFQVVNAFNSAFGAFRTMQYQNYLSERIEEIYRCDGLTRLFNRMALKNLYPGLLEKCNGKLNVVLADLDDLKGINDNYGHDDGDFAICSVADALKSACPEDAVCVRWGGDEILAVIPGEINSEKLHSEIDRRLDEVTANSGKEYKISASVGVMVFDTKDNSSFEDMVKITDEVMYEEKKIKRNRAHSVK